MISSDLYFDTIKLSSKTNFEIYVSTTMENILTK